MAYQQGITLPCPQKHIFLNFMAARRIFDSLPFVRALGHHFPAIVTFKVSNKLNMRPFFGGIVCFNASSINMINSNLKFSRYRFCTLCRIMEMLLFAEIYLEKTLLWMYVQLNLENSNVSYTKWIFKKKGSFSATNARIYDFYFQKFFMKCKDYYFMGTHLM